MEIRETDDFDGGLHNVCGYIPLVEHQLLVPRSLKRDVFYGEGLPFVSLSLVLSDSNRYEVVGLEVKTTEDAPFVSSNFLTKLSLPQVIRQATVEAIPNSEYWLNAPESYDEDYLAQLYWFEHITWGAPRQAVINVTGWSRANANHHIRRISKFIKLPGFHSDK